MSIHSAGSSDRVAGRAPDPYRLRASAAVLILLFLAAILSGCRAESPRPTPRDPSVVGVVDAVDFVEGRTAVITLATGQTVKIDFATADRLYGGGGPAVGDLLLYGSDVIGPWFVPVPPSGDTFRIFTDLVAPSGGTITFEFGLRVPLAKGYREGHGQVEPGAPVIYHLNADGEVVELE